MFSLRVSVVQTLSISVNFEAARLYSPENC